MTAEEVRESLPDPISKKKKKKSTKKKVDPIAEFSKRVVGKPATFLCKHSSGTEKIEGVPVSIVPDPDGRHIIEFYQDEDGSITFLYLDQVAQFITYPSPTEAQQESYYDQRQPQPQPRRRTQMDMRRPPFEPHEYAGVDPTYNPYPGGGQPVDEVYYSAGRRGPVVANNEPPVELRRTERIE